MFRMKKKNNLAFVIAYLYFLNWIKKRQTDNGSNCLWTFIILSVLKAQLYVNISASKIQGCSSHFLGNLILL